MRKSRKTFGISSYIIYINEFDDIPNVYLQSEDHLIVELFM